MHTKTVYLAGQITGDEGYYNKFLAAAKNLTAAGFAVMNPAVLPEDGFSCEAYMRISGAMQKECEAVCFLPGWLKSRGARAEYIQATVDEQEVFEYADWLAGWERKNA